MVREKKRAGIVLGAGLMSWVSGPKATRDAKDVKRRLREGTFGS